MHCVIILARLLNIKCRSIERLKCWWCLGVIGGGAKCQCFWCNVRVIRRWSTCGKISTNTRIGSVIVANRCCCRSCCCHSYSCSRIIIISIITVCSCNGVSLLNRQKMYMRWKCTVSSVVCSCIIRISYCGSSCSGGRIYNSCSICNNSANVISGKGEGLCICLWALHEFVSLLLLLLLTKIF